MNRRRGFGIVQLEIRRVARLPFRSLARSVARKDGCCAVLLKAQTRWIDVTAGGGLPGPHDVELASLLAFLGESG